MQVIYNGTTKENSLIRTEINDGAITTWLKQVPVGAEVIVDKQYIKEVGEFINPLTVLQLGLEETMVYDEISKGKYIIPTKYLTLKH